MLICIPTETNEGLNAQVYGHFGSAPFFTLVETETQVLEIMPNANAHHEHGSCQPLAALAGKKVDAVVTGGMGARALSGLNAAGVRAYLGVAGTVAELLARFQRQEISELTPLQACTGHGCH